MKPSRVIHFFDPSNAKMAAKLPELAQKADILLGNLEDAIPGDEKVGARVREDATASRGVGGARVRLRYVNSPRP